MNNTISGNIGSGVTLIPPKSRKHRSAGARDIESSGGVESLERSRDRYLPPKRRGYTVEPAPDVLDKLISRAVEALNNGFYWDRGSIINIVI